MSKIFLSFIFLFLSLVLLAQNDCTEPGYINKIKGFEPASCVFSEFKEHNFSFYDLKGKYTQLKKSGTYFRINYEKDPNESRNLSGDYIRQNYLNAVLKVKGENLSRDKEVYKFKHEGKSIYMMVDNAWDADDQGYQVYIIEESGMQQEIEISIKDAIDADGKAALYGIFFDVDKSVIKSGSDKELTLLVSYLKENAAVQIFVVGHTDHTGNFAHNIKLSKERAQAVVAYLVSKGISPNRLTAEGVGPLCPVGTNKSEDGRKKNRRVEIVLK